MELFLPFLEKGGPWMFTIAMMGWLVWWSTKQAEAARSEFLQAFKDKRAEDITSTKQERDDYLAALKSQTESHQSIMTGVTEQMKSISSEMKSTNQVLTQLVTRAELAKKS